MTSEQAKWNCSKECHKTFDTIKKLLSRETLPFYPNFKEPFEIHTNVSKLQLGSVISQYGNPITFCSKKLNPAQINYNTTERGLLSIIEIQIEFRATNQGIYRL